MTSEWAGGINPDDYPEHTTRSLVPTGKVTAAGAGGAAGLVVVWVVSLFGLEMPGPVGAAVATLLAFAAGYLKSDPR